MSSFFGLPCAALRVATLGGILFGVAYTLSPVAAWFLLLTPLFFRWASRGLRGRERLWVNGVFAVALALRILALVAFFLLADNFSGTFGVLQGDERAIKEYSLLARSVALGDQISAEDVIRMSAGYGKSVFIYVSAFLQILLGPSPLVLHLLNVAAFLIGAGIMHRLVRSAYGALPALCGLVIVLFMPSLFVWSISALKEATYFLMAALSISSVERMLRAPRVRVRLAAVLVAVLAVAGAGMLRAIGVLMTGGGLSLGLLARVVTLRAWVCLLAILGLSIGGYYAAGLPRVQERVQGELSRAAMTHIGHINTPGYTYKLLDPYLYTSTRYINDNLRLQPDEAARFVARAAITFVTVPLPWKADSRSMVAFLPQQVLWYVLVLLACVGVGAGFRRDALVTWLLLGIVFCGSVAIAIHSGNVGTLVRMRDMVVPMSVWLSALGACTLVEFAVPGHRLRRRLIDPQNSRSAACR